MKNEITGCSTASFYPMQIEEALDILVGMDCKNVELFINASAEMTPGFIKELRRRTDDAGVTVTSVHPYTSAMEGMLLFSEYDRRTQEGFELYSRYMETAAMLGAAYVVIHGLYRMRKSLRSAHGISDETYYERMGKLFEMGRQLGAVPAQENVFNHRSSDPAFIAGMRKCLGNSCAFVLDLKQCRLSKVVLEEMMDAMGPRLSHVHLSDSDDQQPCILPGRGTLDLNWLRGALQSRGYEGKIVTEVYRDAFQDMSELKESLAYTRQYFS